LRLLLSPLHKSQVQSRHLEILIVNEVSCLSHVPVLTMIYSEDGDGMAQDVFKAIFVNDFDGLQKIYAKHDLSTDILDEHGMTPLQHAAYKGNEQIVRWLLNRVSDC